ncbi:MAG TPA: hypothetical protein VJ963_02855 [Bacteroidales bacterium]|nr:hypothetical protein [Bacteroidales bacterium]
MNSAAVTGSFVVIFALLFYTIGFLKVKKIKAISNFVLVFYTIGVSLDITATTFMIIGSTKGIITPHGLIGYSALLAMLTDTVLFYRHRMRSGAKEILGKGVQLYSILAYSWWVICFITGGLLVLVDKMPK